MSEHLFGTDGVRGVAGEFPVDADGARRLGLAMAGAACGGGGTVFVGRDTRPSGIALTAGLSDGLRAGGCDVVELGIIPTPAVAYFVQAYRGVGGISISASHNPAPENGFKVFGPGGEKLSEEVEARVAAAFAAEPGPAATRGGFAERRHAAEEYVDFAVSTVPAGARLAGLKIALDCARGATSVTTPLALARLGVELETTCCDTDGSRINESCGSLHPETVAAVAREHGADVGLAHDGDGDRLVLVDELGEVVCGDRILGLTAAAMYERHELTGDAVVGTILSNFGLERWLREQGLTFYRSDVGDRNVWNMMRRHDVDLGGEPSGHTIIRPLSRTDDALLTALHVLALMSVTGRRLHDLSSGIPLVPQATRNVRVAHKPSLASLPSVQTAIGEAERQLNGDGRLVVRYSGTEPLARILAEGPDPEMLSQVVTRVASSFAAAGVAA